jgi:hypothetical protein
MAAGAKPVLESLTESREDAKPAPESKPLSLKDRVIRKLTEIFEHNERLGSTRQ